MAISFLVLASPIEHVSVKLLELIMFMQKKQFIEIIMNIF
jgi:hypothetical protein